MYHSTQTPRKHGPTAVIGLLMVLMLAAAAYPQQAPEPVQPEIPTVPAPQQPPVPDQPEPQQPPVPEEPQVTPLPMPQQPQDVQISDEELEQFASAVIDVQQLQFEAQQSIENLLAESELSRDRFVEILESEQAMGAGDAVILTEEERQEFDSVMENIAVLQTNVQEESIQAVRDAGLTLERFDQILSAVQADPSHAERLRPFLEQEQSSVPTDPSTEQ